MGKAQNAPGQIISLPQGGGALRGIGETFAADQFTGSGTFSVPIQLPPGRNGLRPPLQLAYSSASGNGPFGLGWDLSVPSIARKTSGGVPVYDDARDVFILSGVEDLVPLPDPPAGTRAYRPRTEGLFAQITFDVGAGVWQVRNKDGLVSTYGGASTAGGDPAVVADPADRRKVFAWKLTQTQDAFGNRVVYEYARDLGGEGLHRWDQLSLWRIRYVEHDTPSGEQFLITVQLDYEGRPDPRSHYRAGFEVRETQRCRRIAVFAEDPNVPVRSYDLSYLDTLTDQANRVSLLGRIEVHGYAGSAPVGELPPLDFAYTPFELAERRLLPVSGPDAPGSLAHPALELVDVQGNGLPGVLEINGTARYWRNRGEAVFDRPRSMPTAPAGLSLADPGVQLLDADGNGLADLLVTTQSMAGYYPLASDATWGAFRTYPVAPSFDLKDPEVKLVDLDGDGVTDALRSGIRLEYFPSDPIQGWGQPVWIERRSSDVFPDVTFSDPRVKWADMSGDGLQDIVFIADGRVEYWPSLGRANWAPRVSMSHPPRLPYGYDPKRLLLGDLDGDGVADLVYVDDRHITLWINQSGKRWSDPITISGTPACSSSDAVRLVDLLGAGVAGILWTTEPAAGTRSYFLDLTGSRKPYLLNQMDNHLGAVTQIEYVPSTRDYLADDQLPTTRWRTPLPFPVQVVGRVDSMDQFSGTKLTSHYAYHHGYWDGIEREFRGFGRVDRFDAEIREAGAGADVHYSPPTQTRTWFHQGAIDDGHGNWSEADFSAEYWQERLDDGSSMPSVLARPDASVALLNSLPARARRDALRALRGQVLRIEQYALDATPQRDRPYTVTERVCGVREEVPPGADEPDRTRIFFPFLAGERSTRWERGSDPLTHVTFNDAHDDFGQLREQVAIAVPRGRRYWQSLSPPDTAPEPYLVSHTHTDYASSTDPAVFLVDAVSRTTTYAGAHDGRPDLTTVHANLVAGAFDRPENLTAQSLNYYDGPAFTGLPFGQVGGHGVLARTETLVLTESIVAAAYGADSSPALPAATAWLTHDGAADWPAEYPPALVTLLGAGPATDPTRPGLAVTPAGYGFSDGSGAAARGFFAATDRRRYDVQDASAARPRGLIQARRDALGGETSITFDAYGLLPASVTDPGGLTTQAAHDYRSFQPSRIVDPNQNQTQYAYSPCGLLTGIAVLGKDGAGEGDLPLHPSTRYVHSLREVLNSPAGQPSPVYVHTLRRVAHPTDIVRAEDARRAQDNLPPLTPAEVEALFPDDEPTRFPTRFVQAREYSDGFGRVLQTRAQAEDAVFGDPIFGNLDPALEGDLVPALQRPTDQPRVRVSGWTVYDNKARVVEAFEPFFTSDWTYRPPAAAESGLRVITFYDARGQVVRTIHPDGSEQRIIRGVPGTIAAPDVSQPDAFEPTAWETHTYDANDNAGRTAAADSSAYRDHWDTPASAVVDGLGRVVTAVARGGAAADAWRTTRTVYDNCGNPAQVLDESGRSAFVRTYDLLHRPLRILSLDAGIHRTMFDAAGNAVEQRDGKGGLRLELRDRSQRPSFSWARDQTSEPVTLRGRIIYGDDPDSGLSTADAQQANLLGRAYREYDEAGLLQLHRYDFKGNLLDKTRQVIVDGEILQGFSTAAGQAWQVPAYRVDWQPAPGQSLDQRASVTLDPTPYQTTHTYDALNRLVSVVCPTDVSGHRSELRPSYNQAGSLERVTLDGAVYVERIAYNAKSQRTFIAYGNGVLTRYGHEPATFRLARLRTESYVALPSGGYRPQGTVLQDVAYAYDLVGNPLSLVDATPGSGLPSDPDHLARRFSYNPLYQLLSATGREGDIPASDPWDPGPRDLDVTRARAYTEAYTYDTTGNLQRVQHTADAGGFTRTLALARPASNQLGTVTIGTTSYRYTYDAAGNLTGETTSRHFEWDYANRMRVFRTQTDGAEPTVHAHYLYDASGQRVKKLVRKKVGTNGAQIDVTVYIDGLFEYRRLTASASAAQANNKIHVMDNQQRIALARVGPPLPDETGPAIQYHLADHLGSSMVVVDDQANWTNREEYSPYGETTLGSFALKRYRFTGKERDDESGLYYYGVRYYLAWLGRWASCDPAGAADGANLYTFASSNPITFRDKLGYADEASFEELNPVVDELNKSDLAINVKKPSGAELRELPKADPRVELNPDARPQADLGARRARRVANSPTRNPSGVGKPQPGDEMAHMSAARHNQTSGIPNDIANDPANIKAMPATGKNARVTNPDGTFRDTDFHAAHEDLLDEIQMRNQAGKTPGTVDSSVAAQDAMQEAKIKSEYMTREHLDQVKAGGPALPEKGPPVDPSTGRVIVNDTKEAANGSLKVATKEAVEIGEKEALNQGAKITAKETLKIGAEKAAKFVPFLGIAVGVYLVQKDLREGDYTAAAWDTAEAIPGVGDFVGAFHLGMIGGEMLGNRLSR